MLCNINCHKVLEGVLTAKIANNFLFFVFPIYKGLNIKIAAITKETYENSSIEVITDNFNNLWLNERHVEKQLGLTNLPKKQRYELNESTNQPNRRFIHADLALKIIMNCRTDESCNLKSNLEFTLHDVVYTKEQSVIKSIKSVFEEEDMQTQYSVLSYRIDLYFHKYKLAIETDELGHADRNVNDEIERKRALEREPDCVFIRIDPDAPNCSMLREINKIYRHINQVTKQLTEQKTKKNQ